MQGGDSASGRQKQALDLAEVDADEGICAPISLRWLFVFWCAVCKQLDGNRLEF